MPNDINFKIGKVLISFDTSFQSRFRRLTELKTFSILLERQFCLTFPPFFVRLFHHLSEVMRQANSGLCLLLTYWPVKRTVGLSLLCLYRTLLLISATLMPTRKDSQCRDGERIACFTSGFASRRLVQ